MGRVQHGETKGWIERVDFPWIAQVELRIPNRAVRLWLKNRDLFLVVSDPDAVFIITLMAKKVSGRQIVYFFCNGKHQSANSTTLVLAVAKEAGILLHA